MSAEPKSRHNAHPQASTEQDISALLQALQRRHPLGQPQLVQTHISWLLMAGQRVWKIKKPVHLPFLDFRTLAQRRHFCEEELRLNWRFAPEMYLGLRPLWRDAQGLLCWDAPAPTDTNGQPPPPHEWAIEMQRFDSQALLRTRIEQTDAHIDAAALHALGQRLAHLHASANADCPDPHYGSPALIQAEVAQVLHTLAQGPLAGQVPAWRAWVQVHSARLTPLWQARRRLVREVHGDLHLGNVVLWGANLLPFDGIEFQPAMRWLDPVNDIAFLSMDLHAHGRSDLAAHLMDGWLQVSGDFEGLHVWRFYEVYRALVRAMVAQLGAASEGQRYVQRLNAWISDADGGNDGDDGNGIHINSHGTRGPALLITCGLSGSGKSTVASAALAPLQAVRIRSDVERKRLFGLHALADSRQHGLDIYTPQASERTFTRLAELAEQALTAGWSVVVDAACLRQHQRQLFQALAQRLRLPFAILHCQAPLPTLRQRINARQAQGQDASEANAALIEQQQHWMQPFTPEELPCVHPIDTHASNWQRQLHTALHALKADYYQSNEK